MVDGYRVEATGEGVVIMWRKSSFTGEWKPTRYTVKELTHLLEFWGKNPDSIGSEWLLSEMQAAYELELEAPMEKL